MGYKISSVDSKYSVSEVDPSNGRYKVSSSDNKYIVTEIDPSKELTDDYLAYLARTDIDNGVSNYWIGAVGEPEQSKYSPVSFFCGVPMTSTLQRRAFSSIHKYGDNIFLTYQAGETHSINALLPWVLEFGRTDDLLETFETLPIKCIDGGGGVMREIDPLIDGFFPYVPRFAYAGEKLWAWFGTFDLTENPPVLASDYTEGKTYLTYSEDYGGTWSELITLDNAIYYNSSSKPIIVGNEIWIPCYSGQPYQSTILRYNFVTDAVGTKTDMSAAWTDFITAEPAILEYATGKFMCMARVTENANDPGQLGEIEAYSTDGLDWSDFTWHDEGSKFPNQPDLFMYDDIVIYSRDESILYGVVSGDESQIDWLQVRTAGGYWYADYSIGFRQFNKAPTMKRYDPRVGHTETLRELSPFGGTSFCVYDEDSDTLLATRAWKHDSGVYIGEPWVSIIKRNSVEDGPVYPERLLYVAEIPGDSYTSNEFTLWNDYIREGDRVDAYWLDVSGKPTSNISVANEDYSITFTSGGIVTTAKIVYEIIK